MTTRTFYHVSPAIISEVKDGGDWGSYLFFCEDEASECFQRDEMHAYRVDADDDDIIDASSIFHEDSATEDNAALFDVVRDVEREFDVDEDEAIRIIEEVDCSVCEDAEQTLVVEKAACRAAAAVGYSIASWVDERTTVFVIDCKKHSIKYSHQIK